MSSRGSYLEGLIYGILRYVGERSQKRVGGNSHKKNWERPKKFEMLKGGCLKNIITLKRGT